MHYAIQIVILTNDSRDRSCSRRFNKLSGSQIFPKAYWSILKIFFSYKEIANISAFILWKQVCNIPPSFFEYRYVIGFRKKAEWRHPETVVRRCSVTKGVPRNFAKLTGKYLCPSLRFNNIASRPATLLKQRLWHRCFPANFAKFLRTYFFTEHFRCLLLKTSLSSELLLKTSKFLSNTDFANDGILKMIQNLDLKKADGQRMFIIK